VGRGCAAGVGASLGHVVAGGGVTAGSRRLVIVMTAESGPRSSVKTVVAVLTIKVLVAGPAVDASEGHTERVRRMRPRGSSLTLYWQGPATSTVA